jgi:hypothetical protein
MYHENNCENRIFWKSSILIIISITLYINSFLLFLYRTWYLMYLPTFLCFFPVYFAFSFILFFDYLAPCYFIPSIFFHQNIFHSKWWINKRNESDFFENYFDSVISPSGLIGHHLDTYSASGAFGCEH